MTFIIHFQDSEALEPRMVGQKFFRLAKAFRSGFQIPPAVAVSTKAHRLYLNEKQWPEGLSEEISAEVLKIGIEQGISVRSSGTIEDLEEKSFAGQYETFLNITTEADLKEKIEACWKSAQTDAVANYFRQKGAAGLKGTQGIINGSFPLMGVILQKMVHAEYAGVAFSRNPLQPSCDEMVVEAVRGLGDKLVSGRESPYRVYIRKDDALRVEPHSDIQRQADERENLLNPDLWRSIGKLARDLEKEASGKPQDIEWAIDRQKYVWLLQSRAITAIEKEGFEFPSGMWTRKIADDLWADRLTPFLEDAMIQHMPRFDLSDILQHLKIPVVKPPLTTIRGFLYLNCESLKEVLRVIPPRFRTEDVRSFFPPEFDLKQVPSPSLLQVFKISIRLASLLAFNSKSNPVFCIRFTLRKRKQLEKQIAQNAKMPDNTSDKAFLKIQTALEHLALIQENNRWPYSYANFFTWSLRWLVVEKAGLSNTSFLQLLAGKEDNVTITIEREFRRLASIIRENENLRKKILNQSPENFAESAPFPFRTELAQFIQKYGCRAKNRTLYVKRWQEEPGQVVGIFKSLLNRPENRHSLSNGTGIFPDSSNTRKPNLILRALVGIMMRFAVKYQNLREELRFLLDKNLFVLRKSLLKLGENTGLEDTVFFLTISELKSLVDEKISFDAAKDRASKRIDDFGKPFTPYPYFIDGCPSINPDFEEGTIQGIGTSSGKATGRARIVIDPSRANLTYGDILVAVNTDPGWTPILSMVGGIVVEEGGLLNHCSIVARELGIPAVVGIRQVTRMIPEGALITIDGNLGTVSIEQGNEE